MDYILFGLWIMFDYVFPDIGLQDCSLGHCLTSNGDETSKKVSGPN